MFLHVENHDSAQVGEVVSGLRAIHLLFFMTRFDDGFAFETATLTPQTFLGLVPTIRSLVFPMYHRRKDLYRLHRKIEEQFIAVRWPSLSDERGELEEFVAVAEMARQRHSQSRVYRLPSSGDRFSIHGGAPSAL